MKLNYRGYVGSAEMNLEDNCLHGRLQHIDDIVTYEGNTPVELKAAFEAAVDHYLAHCERSGKQPDRPCNGSFNIRVGADRHRQLVKHAQLRGMSLNEIVITALDAYLESLERLSSYRSEPVGLRRASMVADAGKPYRKGKKPG